MVPADTSALADRVVVITGAARGMGAAYVRGFLQAGARVVAADRSWPADVRGKLDANPRVLTLEMDVTDAAQVQRAYQLTIDRFGTVDVLVNNAAMRQRDLYPPSGRCTVLGGSVADWERMFAVNVFGVLRVTQAFVQPMLAQQRGSVITIGSSGILTLAHGSAFFALRPGSREQPYMAAKAAVANLTFYLADEVKARNVAANVVVPGHTRTTGFEEQQAARIAAGGAAAGPPPYPPEHVVPLVLFLATQDANSGLTGRMFDVTEWNLEHGLGDQEAWLARSQPLATV